MLAQLLFAGDHAAFFYRNERLAEIVKLLQQSVELLFQLRIGRGCGASFYLIAQVVGGIDHIGQLCEIAVETSDDLMLKCAIGRRALAARIGYQLER